MRVPGTGKRVYRKRPESEWVVTQAPHLRIVSEELASAVERRFAITQELWGTRSGLARGQQRQIYLFSGLLRCGECGGSITLVGGRVNKSRSEYGCSLHAQRGNAVCTNDAMIQREKLEKQLITGLRREVLREEVIDYVVVALQEELEQRHASIDAEHQRLLEEKNRIDGELLRLVDSIAAGSGSPAIMSAISARELRLRAITDQLVAPGPGSFQEKLDGLRRYAITKLAELRTLLASPSTIHEARALLAERFGKLTLQRTGDGLRANGEIDFFGEESLTRVDGAGGQNRTGYARLFRAALYQ